MIDVVRNKMLVENNLGALKDNQLPYSCYQHGIHPMIAIMIVQNQRRQRQVVYC